MLKLSGLPQGVGDVLDQRRHCEGESCDDSDNSRGCMTLSERSECVYSCRPSSYLHYLAAVYKGDFPIMGQ